jgi:hypothetical protein
MKLAGAVAALCALTLWPAASARSWIGHEGEIEAHLRSADVTHIEEIGTGVTRPRRADLRPATPFASLAWKVLPPGRHNGFWESYKSEIAAYELDKLLELRMVPPAVERTIAGETGAAIMWLDGARSVKQTGGQVPSGPEWGGAIRRMQLFDNLIANLDRNAGNILLGDPGELILIDHSRAFVGDRHLVQKFERVDETLWTRIQSVSPEDFHRVLDPWLERNAVGALLARRAKLADTIDALVKKRGRTAVIIP